MGLTATPFTPPAVLESFTDSAELATGLNPVFLLRLVHEATGDVRIYNPENLPLSDVLLMETRMKGLTGEELSVKALAFDAIRCSGMIIYIPYYYSVKEKIISGCPKCKPTLNI